jgi:DNA-binding HxlR family transcriptional regulator
MRSTGLKLQLVKGNKIVFEMPLGIHEWDQKRLEEEIEEIEEEIGAVEALHDLFSNRTRIKMLCEITKRSNPRFTELMEELDANQKVIYDSLQKMMKNDLVERIERHPRNVHYRLSQLGFASILMCAATLRVMEEIERGLENED